MSTEVSVNAGVVAQVAAQARERAPGINGQRAPATKPSSEVKPIAPPARPAAMAEPLVKNAPSPRPALEVNQGDVAPAQKPRDRSAAIDLANELIGANQSLMIEKNPNGTGFIYQSIDKETGEVTRIWPTRSLEGGIIDQSA